jgi:hypothetical protein
MKYIYLLTLIIGTTYLVGWCEWSKWTYLFMMILMGACRCKIDFDTKD